MTSLCIITTKWVLGNVSNSADHFSRKLQH